MQHSGQSGKPFFLLVPSLGFKPDALPDISFLSFFCAFSLWVLAASSLQAALPLGAEHPQTPTWVLACSTTRPGDLGSCPVPSRREVQPIVRGAAQSSAQSSAPASRQRRFPWGSRAGTEGLCFCKELVAVLGM